MLSVTLFNEEFVRINGSTRGFKNKGLNSPQYNKIGSRISQVICGTNRLTRALFNALYDIKIQFNMTLPVFDEIHRNNYFYTPITQKDIITDNIELMEIEVDSLHTYYANGIYVHNSQGSTVKKVYVVERDLNRLTWDDVQRNQLKYVAFTRASNKLNILQ
jgi:hypothetical protein